ILHRGAISLRKYGFDSHSHGAGYVRRQVVNSAAGGRWKVHMQAMLHVRQSAAYIMLAALFTAGAIAGLGLSILAGYSFPGTSHSVPVFVSQSAGANSGEAAGTNDLGFAPVLKPALPAVVNIASSRVVKAERQPFFTDPFFRRFFGDQSPGPPEERRQRGLGSGVIVSPDGYILTNNHVVAEATEIKVALPDKREFTGKVIGTDPKTDVAVVKIAASGLPTLTLGDSSKIQVGDYALAIGDPFGIG